jgi:hypothetical protein
MNNKPQSKSLFKSVPRMLVLILLLLPVLLIIWSTASREGEYSRFQKEVARIELATGVKAQSVDCHDVEFAPMCYVTYERLSEQKVRSMLSESDYTIDSSPFPANIDARNTQTKTSIGVEVEADNQSTIFRVKDIDVTL